MKNEQLPFAAISAAFGRAGAPRLRRRAGNETPPSPRPSRIASAAGNPRGVPHFACASSPPFDPAALTHPSRCPPPHGGSYAECGDGFGPLFSATGPYTTRKATAPHRLHGFRNCSRSTSAPGKLFTSLSAAPRVDRALRARCLKIPLALNPLQRATERALHLASPKFEAHALMRLRLLQRVSFQTTADSGLSPPLDNAVEEAPPAVNGHNRLLGHAPAELSWPISASGPDAPVVIRLDESAIAVAHSRSDRSLPAILSEGPIADDHLLRSLSQHFVP